MLTGVPGERLSFKERFASGWNEHNYLILSFLIPAVIMYLIYLAMEIHPFGDGSVLVLDLNGQYVSFYEGLRNFVYGDMSLLYSFSRSLGGEFMGMYAYYLASPFSYIVALFPQDMILEALLTIFLLKTGACGFTFGLYLHKTTKDRKNFNKINVIAFSIMYALSAYCVVQQHNSMWIDAVMWLPMIAYGIEELIKKGHYKLYVVSLAVAILSNFYIGWMCCIFCAVYFFAYYFMHNENDRNNPYREKAHFAKSFLRMLFFSMLGVAIAAVIILTAYYSLTFGKTTFSNTNWSLTTRFDLLDMLVKFLPCSFDTVRPEGLPFVYCGVMTLMLIPVYFCSSRFSTREKILSGVLVAFFLLSFLISPVDLVWHGFQKPNWLNYRYSFMLCFVLLVMAFKGVTELKRSHVSPLIFSSGILILFAGIAQKLDLKTFVLGDGSNDRNHEVGKLLTIECIWFTVICVAVYLMVLCAMRRAKKVQNVAIVLVILVSLETFCNGLSNCLDLGSDVVYTKYTTYHDIVDPLRATTSVVKENDKSFYRLEEIAHRKANDNMALNVYGLTSSTSTLNATTIRFIRNMGYLGKSHESRYFGGNVPADSLLAMKYVLAGSSDNQAEYRNNKDLLADERFYSLYHTDENYSVYQNLYALSLAFAVDPSIAEIDMADYQNPYQRINAMITAMLGENETIEVFKPLNDYSVITSNLTSSSRTPTSSSNYKHPFTHYTKTDTEASASVKFVLNLPYIDTSAEDQAAIKEQQENGYGDDDYEDDWEDEEEDIDLVKPQTQYVYFYLASEFQRAFNFSAPAGSYNECYGGGSERSLYIGKLDEGEEHTVSLTLASSDLYVTKDVPLFYYLDYETYVDVMTRLAEAQLNIDEGFSDDHLTGTITTTKETSTVFTSIAYDTGWIVKVDGKRVDMYGILKDSSLDAKKSTDGAVVAFDIEGAGEHTVELIYRPTAFVLGITITIVGLIVFLLIIIFEKTVNKLWEKILFPMVIPVTEPEAPTDKVNTDPTVRIVRNDSEIPSPGHGLEAAEPLHAMKFDLATPLDELYENTTETEENKEDGDN